MASVLTPLNIIQISYASTSPSLSDRVKYPYFMRNVASDADQGIAIADLVAAFGWTNGATINTDDSYGNGLVSYFVGKFNQTSGFKLTQQTFPPGATDVSAQVQALSDANPQFVLLHAIDNDAKTVFKKA
jgi:ABC-type branched-subunit amino acid transport system substrate-binding protein